MIAALLASFVLAQGPHDMPRRPREGGPSPSAPAGATPTARLAPFAAILAATAREVASRPDRRGAAELRLYARNAMLGRLPSLGVPIAALDAADRAYLDAIAEAAAHRRREAPR